MGKMIRDQQEIDKMVRRFADLERAMVDTLGELKRALSALDSEVTDSKDLLQQLDSEVTEAKDRLQQLEEAKEGISRG